MFSQKTAKNGQKSPNWGA